MGGSSLDVAGLLNYGGLGLLALLCLIVLGYNAWNLNALVKDAQVPRLRAAKPLLQMQMAISAAGLVLVGGAALYLAVEERREKQVRTARLVLDPWDNELDARYRPSVSIGDQVIAPPKRLIKIDCEPGTGTDLLVNIDPYVKYRIDEGAKLRAALVPPTLP